MLLLFFLRYVYAIYYGIIDFYEVLCKKKQMTVKVVDEPSLLKSDDLQLEIRPDESVVSGIAQSSP